MKTAIKNAKTLRKNGQLNIVDVYKLNNIRKTEKGISEYGEIIFGYPYSPEYFVRSDITQRMCRFYVTVGGINMHPSELDKVKVTKDGLLKISKRETVSMEFNGNTERFFSFNNAISEAAHLPVKPDAEITLSSSNGSITLSKAEWSTKFHKIVDRATFIVHLSFQEFCDTESN